MNTKTKVYRRILTNTKTNTRKRNLEEQLEIIKTESNSTNGTITINQQEYTISHILTISLQDTFETDLHIYNVKHRAQQLSRKHSAQLSEMFRR